MYWNPKMETMSREEIKAIQSERLVDLVERVYFNVPHYRHAFQEKGLEPGDINSVDDLKHLPFTMKSDLRDSYPYGMFATPVSEIVRLHASSGTTGKPTVVGYTRRDLTTWAEIMARALTCGGVKRESVVQNAYGYGLFTGGLGVHYGVERLGASVIPISGGNTNKQIMLMQDFGTTVLTCTPSYAIYLAETMEKMGIDPKSLKLENGIFGGEPWSENMRLEIEKRLGITALDIYGLSEVMGPGVACECEAKAGMHIYEDHFIPEIIDPQTEEVLPYGTKGELVFTTITKEGIPLLRYRTRDISILNDQVCSCGRTHVRMGKVMGRTDDMLVIRGVNVFPTQVESVLLDIGETEPHYQLVVNRKGNLDVLEIHVEVSEAMFSDQISDLERLQKVIAAKVNSTLGISAKIKLAEPNTIPRSEGKSVRVIDNREL